MSINLFEFYFPFFFFFILRNGVKGSAVCVYDVNSLEKAFNGPFQHQKSKDSIWEPTNDQIQTAKVPIDSFNLFLFNNSLFINVIIDF